MRHGTSNGSASGSLADRLTQTLQAARGNLQIRERLKDMLAESNRLEAIVRELGPRHALVRDLLVIARQGNGAEER
jgi:hypothetical protein